MITSYAATQQLLTALAALNEGRTAILEWVENDSDCSERLREALLEQGWRAPQ